VSARRSPPPLHLACRAVPLTPAILARGPWALEQVTARWCDTPYEPPASATEAADAADRALRERGSPAHDGLSARLVSHARMGRS